MSYYFLNFFPPRWLCVFLFWEIGDRISESCLCLQQSFLFMFFIVRMHGHVRPACVQKQIHHFTFQAQND